MREALVFREREETMNVSFIPTVYRPSDERLQELHKIQEVIYFTRVEWYQNSRHLPLSQQRLRKEEMHQTFRNCWKLLEGGKDLQAFLKPDKGVI